MTELKPCPFCGGAADLVEDDHGGRLVFYVQCQRDGCDAAAGTSPFRRTPAIEAWNRRTYVFDEAKNYTSDEVETLMREVLKGKPT